VTVADAGAAGRPARRGQEPGGLDWRRGLIAAFIVAWLSVQVVVPFVQKFELPSLSYRWARFSWAMFSRLGPRYEVRLFRTRGAGPAEAVPGIEHDVRGYRSPEPMRMIARYWSEREVHDRLARLVRHLADERRDGYTYVASVRWTAYRSPDVPEQLEFRAEAAARDR
jgi:hypothetical protein